MSPDLQEIAAALSRHRRHKRHHKPLQAPLLRFAVVVFLYAGLILLLWITRATGID